MPSVRKSSYMISMTGRMPCIAAPTPAPTIAISEIGALRTRSGPNSPSIPAVTPIEPPISAMSSPTMNTSLSCRIACDRASRTASLYESSGIDVLERVLRVGIGAVFRKLDRALDDVHDLGLQRLELIVRELELRPRELEGIVVVARILDVLLRAVHLRIADVVAVEAVRVAQEEHRR